LGSTWGLSALTLLWFLWTRLNRVTQWDVAPDGYEGMTVDQVMAINPAVLASASVMHEGSGLGGHNSGRQARKLYVGNLSPNCEENLLLEFLTEACVRLNILSEDCGDTPVANVAYFPDRNFAFVEFFNAEMATDALEKLDGLPFMDMPLKVKRPHDFKSDADRNMSSQGSGLDSLALLPAFSRELPKVLLFVATIGGGVGVNPDATALTAASIQTHLPEHAVIADIHLQQVTGDQTPSYAVVSFTNAVEFSALPVTDAPIFFRPLLTSPDTATLADGTLHSEAARKLVASLYMSASSNPIVVAHHEAIDLLGEKPTRVVCVLNMARPEALCDSQDYLDVYEDAMDALSSYGQLLAVVMPKPEQNLPADELNNHASRTRWLQQVSAQGVGKIFAKFASLDMAKSCQQGMAGCRYNGGRTVVTSFFSEVHFESKKWA
jgi:splicing factor U2AF 65 kDa subunit